MDKLRGGAAPARPSSQAFGGSGRRVRRQAAEEWLADFLDRPVDESRGGDRKFVTALARGLAVLRAFEDAGEALGNQELAAATGLPPPTITRLTYTLTRLGYLTYSAALGKYRMGPAALSLGHTALLTMRIRSVARPHLQQFADHVGVSVGLGMRNALHMVLVESCHSQNTITLRLDAGARLPLATTSMGRAFLAALPEDERDYLMDRLARRHGPRWPALHDAILAAADELAAKGFCTACGEWISDVWGAAVPVPLREGLFAINCGGPGFRITRSRLEREVGPGLAVVAGNIRRAAGE